ncbi:tail fiber protein [Oceanihabitans sp. 2_MG-2023]|uniref:phage tail protein n=1 Tax=Oceanihabitans sp. 2_MG-2023 TaxID=3062661 RepID=UPI0026E38EB8|nr:tail fiber protein [Oceanihabitans sp. 2_MG-2023]MDO6596379.1 tail fiber protein [Oceanihabitans sp. 2_MG-2023]
MKKIITILSLVICLSFINTSQAQTDGLIGEVQMFAGNFAPRNWAFCNGQLLLISDNTALFSILGTTYGGDGRTTFGLPDLRGRVVIHPGSGPGLSPYSLGQNGGVESVTLSPNQIPSHAHTTQVNATAPVDSGLETDIPNAAVWAQGEGYGTTGNTQMSPTAVQLANTGGSLPHTNIAPYKAVNYIICLNGYYPSRD